MARRGSRLRDGSVSDGRGGGLQGGSFGLPVSPASAALPVEMAEPVGLSSMQRVGLEPILWKAPLPPALQVLLASLTSQSFNIPPISGIKSVPNGTSYPNRRSRRPHCARGNRYPSDRSAPSRVAVALWRADSISPVDEKAGHVMLPLTGL